MRIKEIEDKDIWELFASSYIPNTFLQSWGWGQYQKLSGNKIFRLGLFDKGELVGVCLATKIRAKKGPLLYCQHGPLIDWRNRQYFGTFLDELKRIGNKEGVWFIRLTPLIEDIPTNHSLLQSFSLRKAPVHNIDAQITLILDLNLDEKTLLENMRKSTRYEIRKALREGVTVYRKKGKEALGDFYKLYRAMHKRQKFIPYPYERFENEYKAFSNLDQQKMFFARYKGELSSVAIINLYGQTAFYNHGATVLRSNNVSTSHLLQWEIIRYAKDKGLRFYNFWGGIAPEKKRDHPWWGITVFKRGFGGKGQRYIHAQDLPLKRRYYFTFFVEKLRRKKMGF